LRSIITRYQSASIIAFADFNINRDTFKSEIVNQFKGYSNMKFHFDTAEYAFTRYRATKNRIEKSYLDYMITNNIDYYTFDIKKPIGDSDHWSLHLTIKDKSLGEFTPTKEITYNFSKVKEESEKISESFLRIIEGENKVNKLKNFIKSLRKDYKPRCKKKKISFELKDMIKELIDSTSQRNPEFWKKLSKMISSSSSEDYNRFMLSISELQNHDKEKETGKKGVFSKNLKEFYLKIRFYTQINKSAGIMNNLEIHHEDEEMMELLTNKFEIDDKVVAKYKSQFRDNGVKDIHETIGPCITITGPDISFAMETIAYEKATSWDYIPGKVFKIIYDMKKRDPKKSELVSMQIANLLNDLLSEDQIPEEIICARLICLNKCPDLNGKLENIRPIAITGTLIKILEKVTLSRMQTIEKIRGIHNHKSQIGFLKGMGCDVNIMRLRQRYFDTVHRCDPEDRKSEKYIFFIDLKAAYDSVNHKILFQKLSKKGYPDTIVNTIKKIYSSAKMRLNTLHDPINVNRGVLQGGILSPFLFNSYIDDLIMELNKVCEEVLAYADDLALICKNGKQLDDAMNILSEWSKNNDIAINKKKSGIMVIDQDRGGRNQINGYPIKINYKYLGIILDRTLNPIGSLEATFKKLATYFSRNAWLVRKYFTPKSLVTIALYFQYSRIGYGMNCFLDMPEVIKKTETLALRHTKSILKIGNTISNDKIRITLNRPEESKLLWALMRKNLEKYREHFGEDAMIYNKVNWNYEKWLRTGNLLDFKLDLDNTEYHIIKKSIAQASKNEIARRLNISIGKNFNEIFRKRYFKFPDLRDYSLIRYLTNGGFYKERLFPICQLCGGKNSRTHVTNDCKYFTEYRESAKKKLKEELKLRDDIVDLESVILRLYFNPEFKDPIKTHEIIKNFANGLGLEYAKLRDGIKSDDDTDDLRKILVIIE
jgi:hypothetical protein